MQPVVNFLPWRRQQRLRCIRFWAATFIVTAFVIALGGTLWRTSLSVDRQAATLWLQSEAALLSELVAAEQPMQLRYQHWQQRQATLLRRQRTFAWQQTLLMLAQNLPAKAWLTALRWQENRLELSGLASAFSALGDFEQRLKELEGFHLQPAGAMQRDAQGRWEFHFQLNREREDDPR